jgi:hypothetical protein
MRIKAAPRNESRCERAESGRQRNHDLPQLATKAELNGLKSDISAMETRIVRWIVATTIAAASVAFTIAKSVK